MHVQSCHYYIGEKSMSIPPGAPIPPGIGGVSPSSSPAKEEKAGILAGEHDVREIHTASPATPQESEVESIRRVSQSPMTVGTSPVEEKEKEGPHLKLRETRTPADEQVEHVRQSVVNPTPARLEVSSSSRPLTREERVETSLFPWVQIPGMPNGPFTIEQRMRDLGIPGVSIAVINEGRIEWSKGYGDLARLGMVSQAGSISKVFASLAILSLIEQCRRTSLLGQPSGLARGVRIDLNTDVRDILGEDLWTRIDPKHLTEGAGHEVTIRQLLSHTAGIVPGGSEYMTVEALDYQIAQMEQELRVLERAPLSPISLGEQEASHSAIQLKKEKLKTLHMTRQEVASTPIPSLDDILQGRTELGLVSVKSVPGERFDYSNPGFTILQKVVEVVTNRPFTEVVRDRVLTTLGMNESTYSPQVANTISGHEGSEPLLGLWRFIPHSAAGGLWTTAGDLAKAALGLQRTFAGEDTRLIGRELVAEMTRGSTADKGYGLGLGLEHIGDEFYFGHSGGTPGFITKLIANSKGQGVAILTNSSDGDTIVPEIIRSVSHVYGWPEGNSLQICQPRVKPEEMSSSPINLETWANGPGGVSGRYVYREEEEGHPPREYTVFVHFDRERGKVLAEEESGKNRGRILELTPLGTGVACYPLYAPGKPGPLGVCRFIQEAGKKYLEIFGAKHALIDPLSQ